MNVAYLGPQGTFTHEAATRLYPPGDHLEPLGTVAEVLQEVASGRCSAGVVPIENSVQGEVTATLDALVFDNHHLLITGETLLPVTFCAFRRPGETGPVTAIHSHPHALAQCAKYVREARVRSVASSSTAEACRMVANGAEAGAVAIASHGAGELYGLTLVTEQIEDFPGAFTRFLSIGTVLSPRSGNDKSAFVVVPKSQGKGVLAEILETLADDLLDVLSLHSRPIRRQLGTYCFFFSVSGHLKDRNVFDALSSLLRAGHRVRFLGSYACAPSPPAAAHETEEIERFITSVDDLVALRNG